jgi:hypothetical protein
MALNHVRLIELKLKGLEQPLPLYRFNGSVRDGNQFGLGGGFGD